MIRFNIGDRFGKLTIVSLFFKQTGSRRTKIARVICDCGKEKDVRPHAMLNGATRSCRACNLAESGDSYTVLYSRWSNMITRVTSEKPRYKRRYKDRGINVCDEWIKSFSAFKDWAVNNGYREELEIDRIDNNKGYYPDNCRFVSHADNINNRERTIHVNINGQVVPLSIALRKLGIMDRYKSILSRMNRGLSFTQACINPIKTRQNKGQTFTSKEKLKQLR